MDLFILVVSKMIVPKGKANMSIVDKNKFQSDKKKGFFRNGRLQG